MWSGTTFRKDSGRVMGVHQRIDRVARRRLSHFLQHEEEFPDTRHILRFEGIDGPDGIKRKSPGIDEPWHFFDPEDSGPQDFLDTINDHLYNLTESLKQKNMIRAAFEAAWFAHAITDGLTPAHHYPFEEKMQVLRGGTHHSTRVSKKDKLFMPGKNKREFLKNNWAWWGAKGIMTSHVGFEWGVATAIVGRKMHDAMPSKEDILLLETKPFQEIFIESAQKIAALNMYHSFIKDGWTRTLASQVQHILAPEIARIVTLGWLYAVVDARGGS